jgi:hypothetical protein
MPLRRNSIRKTRKGIVTSGSDGAPRQVAPGLQNQFGLPPQALSTGPPLLTTAEAAAYLGCSKSLLDKLRVRGGGPDFVQVSNDLVRYELSALNRFIAARTRKNTAQVALE